MSARQDTYDNFKKLPLSKDGDSHFIYLLNETYYDPFFIVVGPGRKVHYQVFLGVLIDLIVFDTII